MSATIADAASIPAETISEGKLFWRRFRRHRLAVAGLIVTLTLYLIALLAEPVGPFDPNHGNARLVYHPPQAIQWFDASGFHPHVLGYRLARDPVTLAATYVPDPKQAVYLGLWVKGDPYMLWGLIPGRIICSARSMRASRCSCSAPTGWGATCSAASCSARARRCRSASSA